MGGQDECDRRIEVFVKIQKKKFGWGEGRLGVGLGGQGRCARRIEVFVKIQKNWGVSGGVGGREGEGWAIRVDVIE